MVEREENLSPYVLTLTIIDGSTLQEQKIAADSKVMCCVRNRVVNETHPDVVSVPTQRIPYVLALDIISAGEVSGQHDKTILFEQEPVSNRDTDGHNSAVFAVESLLCRKLGVSSELEKNEIEFEVSLSGTHAGIAEYKNLSSQEELQMINLLVVVNRGADKFPEATTSFDHTKWATIEGFLRMWDDGKDTTLVGIDPDAAMGVCVDGLCILSTYDILKSKL